MRYGTFRAFNEISTSDFEEQQIKKIKNEISGKSKQYILSVDDNEYKNYLINEYSLTPLQIYPDSEIIDEPSIHKEIRQEEYIRGYQYEVEIYEITVNYQYTGSEILFKIRPNYRQMRSSLIYVVGKTVSFTIRLSNKNPEEFKRNKKSEYDDAFINLKNVNDFALQWNSKLAGIIDAYFQQLKRKYLDENNFFAAINVKVNNNTQSVFTVPTVNKKIIPQPVISKNCEFHSEPTMSKAMYDDILKVIYDSGKSMEKKPSLYKDKDEESLRDQFLLFLETRYDATTATGETFNKNGKTDILLKYANDSSNVFIAECKFWHGASEFQKAINQLFGYLTWRDSKVALIIFVTNKDFTNVITTIQTEMKSHSCFEKENGKRGETSFSYIFHLPQDKEKLIYLETIVFHFDK